MLLDAGTGNGTQWLLGASRSARHPLPDAQINALHHIARVLLLLQQVQVRAPSFWIEWEDGPHSMRLGNRLPLVVLEAERLGARVKRSSTLWSNLLPRGMWQQLTRAGVEPAAEVASMGPFVDGQGRPLAGVLPAFAAPALMPATDSSLVHERAQGAAQAAPLSVATREALKGYQPTTRWLQQSWDPWSVRSGVAWSVPRQTWASAAC